MVEQFIQGRKYLKAVSPKTLIWYQCSFKAFDGATSSKEAIDLPLESVHLSIRQLFWSSSPL